MSISPAPQGPMVNFNGALMHASQVPIGPYHNAVMFGQSVYDAVFAAEGRPFRLDAHLDRLERSARAAGWDGPSREVWKEMIASVIKAYGERDQIVYMQMSPAPLPYERFGEENERDMLRKDKMDAWVLPLQAGWLLPTPAILQHGITLASVVDPRHDFTDVKTTSLFATSVAKREAVEDKGASDALLVGKDGNVKECTAANIHVVVNGPDGQPLVITPTLGSGLLEGIRNPIVADLCAELGIAYVRRDVPLHEARNASELLVTSATRGIIPATQLNGQAVGTGRPGPVFAALREGLDTLMREVRTQPFGVIA